MLLVWRSGFLNLSPAMRSLNRAFVGSCSRWYRATGDFKIFDVMTVPDDFHHIDIVKRDLYIDGVFNHTVASVVYG